MIRALLVAVVFVSACAAAVDETGRSASGVIVEPGRLGIAHLQPGDCLRDELADQVEAMVGVPCNREHRAQVVTIGRSADGDLDDPAVIDRLCTVPVEEIGRRYATRDDLPQIDVALLFASDRSRVVCVLEFAEPIAEDLVRAAA